MKIQALAPFRPFVARLRHAATNDARSEVSALLDGAAGEALRRAIGLTLRQQVGAFFTPTALADRCLDELDEIPVPVIDPTCGAGDLLLAVARRLPVRKSAAATLTLWGKCLSGQDVVPEFVEAARLRLILLAMARTGDSIDPNAGQKLLPNIKVGDALSTLRPNSVTGLLFMNPPFGSTTEFARHFNGTGRVARAGVFVDRAIDALKPGATLAAILPDVLRSGTNYRSWRESVPRRLLNVRVSVEGKFDPNTDVDVFTLIGQRKRRGTKESESVDWYQTTDLAQGTPLAGAFDVRVGQIVEYRDPRCGTRRAFITVRDVNAGQIQTRIANNWPAGDRAVRPPFVAISRTSSPHDARRVQASVIGGKRLVAVENHIIVARPRSGHLADAVRLVEWLNSTSVTTYLQRRIRCRHLTVAVIKELSWPGVTS